MSLMSMAEYGRTRNVSRQVITKFKQLGYLKGAFRKKIGRKNPLIVSAIADKVLEDRLSKAHTKEHRFDGMKKVSKEGRTDALEYSEARTWSERYRAADMKLSYEIRQGLWLRRSEVEEELFKVTRIIRDSLLNIPVRVGAILAAESDENKCVAILTKEQKAALNELSMLLKVGVE